LTVLDRISSAQGRRDELPNEQLAGDILRTGNKSAIAELVASLSNRDKRIQSDCIKVLYEIAEQSPNLVAGYVDEFGKLLTSKNNRLAWGAMTALDAIGSSFPEKVYALLPQILSAADEGSVISRDHAVGILVSLAKEKEYSRRALPKLLEQLSKSPDNQFPMYAEMSMPVIAASNRDDFLTMFKKRETRLKKESQRKRVRKVLRKLGE